MEIKKTINIEAVVKAPKEKVWKLYNDPLAVTRWNNASADWHTTKAKNDLKIGGKFLYRMESIDGSAGFDFWGTYDEVKINELIVYTLGDGRKARVIFTSQGKSTKVVITFEAENENPIEMQKSGWQSILNNFKKYVEAN